VTAAAPTWFLGYLPFRQPAAKNQSLVAFGSRTAYPGSRGDGVGPAHTADQFDQISPTRKWESARPGRPPTSPKIKLEQERASIQFRRRERRRPWRTAIRRDGEGSIDAAIMLDPSVTVLKARTRASNPQAPPAPA